MLSALAQFLSVLSVSLLVLIKTVAFLIVLVLRMPSVLSCIYFIIIVIRGSTFARHIPVMKKIEKEVWCFL